MGVVHGTTTLGDLMVETKSLGTDEEEPREMVAKIGDIHKDTDEETCDILSSGIDDEQIHIVLEPLKPSEWKDQHLFLKNSKLVTSSLWEILVRFTELDVLTMDDIAEAKDNMEIFGIVKSNIDHRSVRFKEKKYGKSRRLNWFPEEVMEDG